MSRRSVPFSAFWKLFQNKKPISIIGLAFTLISLIGIPVILFITNTAEESYEMYDHDTIQKEGKLYKGELLAIRPRTNITINGEHPQLLYYKYIVNGKIVTDKFETMDLDRLEGMKAGDTITVKAYQQESVVQNLTPFKFPSFLFFLIPLPFLVIGAVFFGIGLVPALKTYKLYRDGIIKEGNITSMTPIAGRTPFHGGSIVVTYSYQTGRGQTLHAKSSTDEYLILSYKKVGDPIKIFVSEKNENVTCMVPEQESWVQLKTA